jgi:hypothetical protein
MAPRIARGADLADLLDGWAKHYRAKGDKGAALVMQKSAQEIRQLRKDVATVTRVATRIKPNSQS